MAHERGREEGLADAVAGLDVCQHQRRQAVFDPHSKTKIEVLSVDAKAQRLTCKLTLCTKKA